MSDAGELSVDPSNAGALAAWDGGDGDYWTEHADYFEASLTAYDDAFAAAAAISPDDRVLDIGCGTGRATRDAARRASAGTALGIDLSSRMLDDARRRARDEGLNNVAFLQADAQVHEFDAAAYDAVISHNGAMFFGDPTAAFTNLGRALRPGGRLTLLAWQPVSENEWFSEIRGAVAAGRDLPLPPPNAPSPFALADPDRVRTILTDAGFSEVGFDGHHEPMLHGRTADAAFGHLSGLGVVVGLMADLDEAQRTEARGALRASIDAHTTDHGVLYDSAVWIITALRP